MIKTEFFICNFKIHSRHCGDTHRFDLDDEFDQMLSHAKCMQNKHCDCKILLFYIDFNTCTCDRSDLKVSVSFSISILLSFPRYIPQCTIGNKGL